MSWFWQNKFCQPGVWSAWHSRTFLMIGNFLETFGGRSWPWLAMSFLLRRSWGKWPGPLVPLFALHLLLLLLLLPPTCQMRVSEFVYAVAWWIGFCSLHVSPANPVKGRRWELECRLKKSYIGLSWQCMLIPRSETQSAAEQKQLLNLAHFELLNLAHFRSSSCSVSALLSNPQDPFAPTSFRCHVRDSAVLGATPLPKCGGIAIGLGPLWEEAAILVVTWLPLPHWSRLGRPGGTATGDAAKSQLCYLANSSTGLGLPHSKRNLKGHDLLQSSESGSGMRGMMMMMISEELRIICSNYLVILVCVSQPPSFLVSFQVGSSAGFTHCLSSFNDQVEDHSLLLGHIGGSASCTDWDVKWLVYMGKPYFRYDSSQFLDNRGREARRYGN